MKDRKTVNLLKYPLFFNELPIELIELILNKLKFKDILSLRTVNKDLYHTITYKYKRYYNTIPYFLLIPTNIISNKTHSSKTEILPLCNCNIYGSFNLRKIISLKYPLNDINDAKGYHENIELDTYKIFCCHHNYIIIAVKNNRYFHVHMNCNYNLLYSIFNIDFRIISLYDKDIKDNINVSNKHNELIVSMINKSIQYKLMNIVNFKNNINYNNDNSVFIITEMKNVNNDKIYKMNIINNKEYDYNKLINSDTRILPIINI